ncbi:SMP-30/gluconolactonase/LRE family protein [Pseudomonas hunanensis]|uniref:SMP-30/gluconolactonase/LRE family protein n=1 Tax=Pseudomonas hunanensis TaxID=1247546 RepID=UPI003827D111
MGTHPVDGQERATARPSASQAPIPQAESGLPAIIAQHWLQVSTAPTVLEGPSLDRAGNLFLTDPLQGRVWRAGKDGELREIGDFKGSGPGGTAFHRDGRLFVAVTAEHFTQGWILAMQPDGSQPQVIVPKSKGFVPNDLVFDRDGGLYFTDFRGSSTEPTGGAYYLSPDGSTITPVLAHLARANGIALSPDGSMLWVTEHGNNRLHRVRLQSATRPADNGTTVPYHFIGPPPDSLRVDRHGNVYVALNGQGRVLIFANNGVPIAQILLPGREAGRYLDTTNLALDDRTGTLYVVSGDRRTDSGAAVFKAQGLAPGLRLFGHP